MMTGVDVKRSAISILGRTDDVAVNTSSSRKVFRSLSTALKHGWFEASHPNTWAPAEADPCRRASK